MSTKKSDRAGICYKPQSATVAQVDPTDPREGGAFKAKLVGLIANEFSWMWLGDDDERRISRRLAMPCAT
jgi:hypothetical protein